jgi:hypothetical protein
MGPGLAFYLSCGIRVEFNFCKGPVLRLATIMQVQVGAGDPAYLAEVSVFEEELTQRECGRES